MCGVRARRPSSIAIAVCAAALATSASARADERVSSGPLSATIDASPWHVSFAQDGGTALDEATGHPVGSPDGTLGFAGALGWQHATRIVGTRRAGAALVADVATTDPAGRRLEVTVRPGPSGVISLSAAVRGGPDADVTALGIGFDAPAREGFLGFGERSNAVDQRGQDVESYVSDGPFSPDTRPFVAATIPPQGYRARDDATYYPVPWLLSTRGYGVLIDNDETSTFHLARHGAHTWSVEVQARTLSLRVFAGPTPAGALSRFTAATGRQPRPAAPWAFGPWFQTGQPNTVPLEDEAAWLQRLRAADAPVSVAETQLRYLPCGLDRGNEDYERRRVQAFHDKGLAVLTYVNPMLCASYQPLFAQAAGAGALLKTAAGLPSTFNSFVGGIGPAGFVVQPVGTFDFTAPAGRDVYRGVLRRMADAGHDGWMEDFGEYTPPEAVAADGRSGTALHNRYPVLYHCGVAGLVAGGLAPRPLVRFQRSGWTGAARCASDVWGGDPTTTFGYDGLSSAVKQALSIGLSGVSRWGSDIGGYDTLGNDSRLTPELLERWIEFGAVSGVMRTKRSGLALPSYERPQIWDPGILGVWRRYAKLHTQLYPYILAADATYRETGIPLMRQLTLLDPGDPSAAAVDDAFGFGPDILAAPVVTEGATKRRIPLPAGSWLDGARALVYDPRDGAYHVGAAAPQRGGRDLEVDAPVDRLPLAVRSGALLPLLPADVSTLAGYGTGVVHLADRRDRLHLLAYPAGRSRAGAYEHDRLSSRATRGRWRLTIRADRALRIDLEASTVALRGTHGRRFRPCAVRLGRRALPRRAWRFDRRLKVLHVRFRAKAATLDVRDRCGT